MKKISVLFIIAFLIVASFVISFAASYNYSAPPTGTTNWDFTVDNNYTIDGSMNIKYTARKTFLGITTKKPTETIEVKAKTFYYSFGVEYMCCSNGDFIYSTQVLPDTTSTEYSVTITSHSADAPSLLRYEGETYQLNNYTLINLTQWGYNTIDKVVYNAW